MPRIETGETHVFQKPFDASLQAGRLRIACAVTVPGDPPIRAGRIVAAQAGPRPLPHRMPVMMWGIGSPTEFARELPRLKELGFTQCFGFGADYDAIWKAGQPVVADSPADRRSDRHEADARRRLSRTTSASRRRLAPATS